MAEWVNAEVKEVKNWTDALFSLRVTAPIDPFTAGQFAKLALEVDGERVQRRPTPTLTRRRIRCWSSIW